MCKMLLVLLVLFGLPLVAVCDQGDPVLEGSNLFPIAGTTPYTEPGQASYNPSLQAIVIGDGVNTRAMLSGETWFYNLPSPALIPNVTKSFELDKNLTGTTVYIISMIVETDVSGVSLGMKTGVSIYGADYAIVGNTPIFGEAAVTAGAGVSTFLISNTSGTTTVPPDAPILMRLGEASAPSNLRIWLGVRLEGRKP